MRRQYLLFPLSVLLLVYLMSIGPFISVARSGSAVTADEYKEEMNKLLMGHIDVSVVRPLTSLWYDSMKMYAASELSNELQLDKNALSQINDAVAIFDNAYVQAIFAIARNEPSAANSAIRIAETTLSRIRFDGMAQNYRHYLSLIKALNSISGSPNDQGWAEAADILSNEPQDIDTPESLHLSAAISLRYGRADEACKLLEYAELAARERNSQVELLVDSGLDLDVDITSEIIAMCKALLNTATIAKQKEE